MTSFPRMLFRAITSYKLATAVLVLMTLVTLFGTLYQVDHGLFAAKQKYFSSLFLVHELNFFDKLEKPLPLPLPGGLLLMSVLFLNMLAGAIIKVRKRLRGVGLLISHCGMLFLLASGFVTWAFATDGYMALYPGMQSNRVESYVNWQLEVLPLDEEGRAERAHVVPSGALEKLSAEKPATFSWDGLPFEISVEKFFPNASPIPTSAPMAAQVEEKEIDGFKLSPQKRRTEAAQNLPGAYVAFRPKGAGVDDGEKTDDGEKSAAEAVETILWAGSYRFDPREKPMLFSFEMDGKRYAAQLAKKSWTVPFEVQLDEFILERHPGVSTARNYESRVTRIEGDQKHALEIKMNEPMRYAGYTFFQESFGPADGQPGEHYSQFAVANNPADQWPLWALTITGLGLLVHFVISLFEFTKRSHRKHRRKDGASGKTEGKGAKAEEPVEAEGTDAEGATASAAGKSGQPAAAVKLLLAGSALFFASALSAPEAHAAEKDLSVPLPEYEPWPEEQVDTFESLLVQDGGRVKPIYTLARFTLMQFSGRTSVEFVTEDGVEHRISHSEWLMDVLFRPEIAREMPLFIVDDSSAVVQIGVSPKQKRDKYSYAHLRTGRAKLAEEAAKHGETKQKFEDNDQDPQYALGRIDEMVLTLGRNVSSFEYLLAQFGFARKGEQLVNGEMLPPEISEIAKTVDFPEMLTKMPEMDLNQLMAQIQSSSGGSEDEQLFASAMRLLFFHANSGQGLALLPPKSPEQERWISVGESMIEGMGSKEIRPWVVARLGEIQRMVQAVGSENFGPALATFAESQRAAADERGEGDRAGLEVLLYEGHFFGYALVFFIIGFVVLALGWLAPGSKYGRIMVLIACALALVGFALDVTGITLRCLVRNRPPITNLYDTVLFITAVAVLLGLFLEWFTRIGVGAFIAVVAGFLGMFLSIKYEAKEATDTMGQLVAVLDTNFWLWTHVTIINIGYAAAMVAGMLGAVYLVGRFGLLVASRWTGKGEGKDFFRLLTRMNYGIVCFCLFFALVGTVLGGIWANYSWGRFWGWDPKENGALMICLWSLVILHGRMGGFIREVGIHANSLVLAGITAFSWWGVNNLGVGLHSYGFTDGIWNALFTAWGVMLLIMLLGIPLKLHDRRKKLARREAAKVAA